MANSEKTLIVGYPGRLSRAFALKWPLAQCAGRSNFDITDRAATIRLIENLKPQLVLNCAAITDMTKCEANPDMAWAVNVRGVRHMAEACKRVGATLVHFSSDYALDPVNEYGWTKRASEPLADLTIRAKVYDASHWVWVELREGRLVRMLTNEYLNPVSTSSLVVMAEQILTCGLRGLVYAGSLDRQSFWQVGQVWAEVLGVDTGFVVPVDNIHSAVPRLTEMFLDVKPLLKLGIAVPTLRDDAQSHMQWAMANGLMDSGRLKKR